MGDLDTQVNKNIIMSFIEQTPEQLDHSLWVERYRPSRLVDYVGNDHFKEKMAGYIETNDIPHLLLYGKAGGGKTSAAKLLVKNMDCDSMIINASDENNVDTIRNKVKTFASTIGFRPIKVIVLDECLDENTLVTILRDGVETKLAIKDVTETTDLVKSWNVEKSEIQWRPFYLWDKGIQSTYRIELDNGEVVVCTEDHKWYVKDDNDTTIVIKTKDLHKYSHILSPQ